MEARVLQELRTIVGPRRPDLLAGRAAHLRVRRPDEFSRDAARRCCCPSPREQVQAIVRVCHRERIPFVARGSGTGLSGGALPVENGIVISLARMNRILEVDLPNARVVVEPGVINLDVTSRVHAHGILLRARSFVAIGVQHRRQRRGEFRRRALPEIRVHHHARAGTRSGASRWLAGPPRAARRWMRRDTIWRAFSSVRKARWASPPRLRCAS